MRLTREPLWLLMLLVMALAMTVASVHSNELETSDQLEEGWDDSLEDDYSEEEAGELNSPEYNQQQQPPPPPPPPMSTNSYGGYQQPPAPYQPEYQPQSYQPLPPPPPPTPKYQPVPVPLPYVEPKQYPQNNYSQVEYQAPVYQPQPTYQPAPQPVYQPAPQPYKQPENSQAYQQQQQQQPVQPAKPYQAPVLPAPVKVSASNYSAPTQQVYQQQRPQYNPATLARKYSQTDLAPFVSPLGYRQNHWSLSYYRILDHRVCPKPYNYNHAPTLKDVEFAFALAVGQLGYGGLKSGASQNYAYMNMSVPTFAGRHQIASYLTNKNSRMDEEGLLVEYVSQYLADRLCLTKWDRQRYLPSLTKLVGAKQFPQSHTCSQYYSSKRQQWQTSNCYASKYRTYDGFCNNPYHPYWGKADVCHIRLLSPDYADGISKPRESLHGRYGLPNPRLVANVVHSDVPLEGPYNLMKMQWGQFINHDISNTALSSYDGLVDCCKSPLARGCWPIYVPRNDPFYSKYNVSCLNFIRSGVCPTCQLGPRQQTNKNTAFLDCSHVYGQNQEQAMSLRAFVGGLLKTSSGKNGEQLLPVSTKQEQCFGVCYKAGDGRVNQHPALTALHVLLLRSHNQHAQALAKRHPNWNDEILYQEARRLTTAEYQMITYGEYLPIVFGPVLSAYYKLTPSYGMPTYYDPKVDPTTWNEYTTAACRFGHSQISSIFALTTKLASYGTKDSHQETFRLKDWFFRPSLLAEGKTQQLLTGLLGQPSLSVDPWITTDVRNYLYKGPKEHFGGDLAATNIWRGRDHGLPGYTQYVEYCFNFRIRTWKDMALFIPPHTLNQLRKLYRVPENVDLFSGGVSERHFPGADIGPTFACINGIQYYHLKFGDRYYFEHANQAGSFSPAQLEEIRRSSLAKLLCRAGYLQAVPQFAFMQVSSYNPMVNCSQVGGFNYNLF